MVILPFLYINKVKEGLFQNVGQSLIIKEKVVPRLENRHKKRLPRDIGQSQITVKIRCLFLVNSL